MTIADTEPDAAIARVRIDARKWTTSLQPLSHTREMYAQAREDQADYLASEIMSIADDALADQYAREAPPG